MSRDPITPAIPRRAALALGGAALVGGGFASPALAAPLPCLARAGEVVALELEGTGAPGGTVIVFGQAFRPRDMPRNATLMARGADGQAIPAQLDVVARHADGSARWGVVSLAPAGAIPSGRRLGVVLIAGSEPAAPALDLARALANRQAVLELTPQGGAPWTADLLAPLRGGTPADRWQAGPLASQARIVLPVPPAATGGVTSLRLVADIAARADGSLWVEAWLRNDVAMRAGGGAAAYTARVLLDGREAVRTGALRQAQYTGWGRLAGSARNSASPPRVRHDAAYLADAGAVPRYDLTSGVEEGLLARLGRSTAEPGWAVPLSPRGVTQSMPATGGRADIGPATMAQAVWLMTGDTRAAAYAIGQAEASGAVPWHMWDPTGGRGQGGWLDVRRWPRLWTDGRGGRPPGGLMQHVPGDTGWETDPAHQPDLATVPFLLTGRRAFLDEMQAQAAWNPIAQWPAQRGNEQANIIRGNQVRGTAWGLRQLDNAAWVTPEGDPNADYLRDITRANFRWLRSQIPGWTARQGEAHGWVPGEYGVAGALPPWQQDYLASTVAAAARRGNQDAREVLDWMSNFLVGRFLNGERGFEPRDGAAYLIAISPERSPENPYSTWAAIGEATRARGMSNGRGWSKSEGDYPQLALATLSALVEITGTEPARRAHAWLLQANPPFTRPADYARDPIFNIVAAGQPRVPGREQRCAG
ncbi:MAG TPA: hypothetical protein VIL69_02905 [Roseomonas sp.]|jgi:hypothetical protein